MRLSSYAPPEQSSLFRAENHSQCTFSLLTNRARRANTLPSSKSHVNRQSGVFSATPWPEPVHSIRDKSPARGQHLDAPPIIAPSKVSVDLIQPLPQNIEGRELVLGTTGEFAWDGSIDPVVTGHSGGIRAEGKEEQRQRQNRSMHAETGRFSTQDSAK